MTPTLSRILLCSIHEDQFGIDLLQIAEVMDSRPLQPIPRAPHYFRGIVQLHGLLTPVLDLRLYFSPGDPSEKGQLLLVAPTLAHLALWVDSVERIVPTTDVSCAADDSGFFPYLAQLESGEEVRLLDTPLLVDHVTAALAGRQKG